MLKKTLPCLLLAAAALLAFGAVFPGEFVVDDLLWATAERGPPGLEGIFRTFGTWGFQNTRIGLAGPPIYRPLQAVFQMFAQFLLGPNPWAWHLLSIALHVLNAIMLFRLLERLVPKARTPLKVSTALLFLIHPAGSEAVLWISGMSELTVTAVLLGNILLYLRWRAELTPLRIGALAALYFAGCLFKETALVLPLLLGAYELTRGPKEWTFSPALAATAVAVTGIFLFLRQGVIGSTVAGQPLALDPARILALSVAHLRFLLLPGAPPFALRPPEITLAGPLAVAGLVLVAAGLLGALRLAEGDGRLFSFGALWGILALWPAYAVAAVGHGFFNGRQAYLASLGLALLAGGITGRILQDRQTRIVLLMLPLLAWMAYGTTGNAVIWRSNIRVYETAMGVSPSADGPRVAIAEAMERRGDAAGALKMYSEALIRASSPKARVDYLYAMASILGQQGRTQESDRLLDKVLRLDPRYSAAWAGRGNNAWVRGRLNDAVGFYHEALRCNPDNSEAATNLANVLALRGSSASQK